VLAAVAVDADIKASTARVKIKSFVESAKNTFNPLSRK